MLAAADEEAVGLFLEEHIGFLDIPRLVEKALDRHEGFPDPGLGEILEADLWARHTVKELARAAVRA